MIDENKISNYGSTSTSVFATETRMANEKLKDIEELSPKNTTMFTDLDQDSIAHCATYLTIQDVSNLSITCKSLKLIAYSDSIWHHFYRNHWPQIVREGGREEYVKRHVGLRQFKFEDPFVLQSFVHDAKRIDNLILHNNDFIFSQGSTIRMQNLDLLKSKDGTFVQLNDHKARITCMRLFPLSETSLFRSETLMEENALITSSADHSIRLWWKGACQRCFRGHNGPVLTVSDKLLGSGSAKVLASGGEDGTVRLWSLSSGGKRGQHALKATLYGHEKPVKLMSVAGDLNSLLATISNDSKIRVWDTTATSAVRSSCCVGMTSVPGSAVDMKCHESLLYVAAGSNVVMIDLRTMQKVMTAAVSQSRLCSFAFLPSKSLICTGANNKAMLWDIRRNQETLTPEPIAELDGHTGPVTLVHMDPNRIVTGGPDDFYVKVWEATTGLQTNSLTCSGSAVNGCGCTAMAVDGTRILTAGFGEQHGSLCFRDYSHATCPTNSRSEDEFELERGGSKFWDPDSYSD